MSTFPARALGLALGGLADALVADPQRHHPVAWFGSLAARLERRDYRDTRAAGAVHAASCLVPLAVVGVGVERLGCRSRLVGVLATAATTWAVVGGSSLASEGERLAGLVDTDLDAARARLSWLCGRLPDDLDAAELCRAGIESLAENSADAVVASLFWGALCGVPGLLVHRGANTLDAMVGHHNERYERFGTASARLDDLLDWVPARITGALACLLAPAVGGSTRQAWCIMRRDAHDHPSPNGGWCEAAWAGALGVQLGGRNVYPGGRVESRGLLGDGRRPTSDDLRRAARLTRLVQATATVLASGAAFALARAARSVPAPRQLTPTRQGAHR